MAMNVVGAMQYASRIEREALHAKMAATRRTALIKQAVKRFARPGHFKSPTCMRFEIGDYYYDCGCERSLPDTVLAAIRSEFRRLEAENEWL